MTIDEKLSAIARGISMLLVGTGPLTFEFLVRQGEDPRDLINTYDRIIKQLREVSSSNCPETLQ